MSRYKLIDMFKNESAETFNKCSKAYELGMADAFEEFVRLYKVFQDIPCNKDVFPISCDGMCIDCFEKWVKEQNNEY